MKTNSSVIALSFSWCRHHPSQAFYGSLVIAAHVALLLMLATQQPPTLVMKPKGKMAVHTVKLDSAARPARPATKTEPLPSLQASAQQEAAAAKKEAAQEAPPEETEKAPKPEPVKKKPAASTAKKQTKPAVKTKAADTKKKPVAKDDKKKPAKAAPAKTEKAAAAKPKPAAKTKPTADKEKQKLLDQAEASLAKLSNVALPAVSSKLSKAPDQLQELHIDAAAVGDENGLDPEQMGYCDELISRLRLKLRLPEVGEVKIRLTLDRNGKVIGVETVSSESAVNQKYIEKNLPGISFPPFGQFFGSDSKRSFLIALCNED